jgi:hypothetical protein
MAGRIHFQALTVKHTGRAAQIITDLKISAAYDPTAPPNPVPQEITTRALWDTGASGSVISQDIAKTLALTPVGATNVKHAGGSSISPTHLVNFYLPHGPTMTGALVTEFQAQPQFGAIIGMDIITMGDLAITNVGGQTVMSFRLPSIEMIDYVIEANRIQKAAMKYPRVGANDPCPCGSGQKYKRCHGRP